LLNWLLVLVFTGVLALLHLAKSRRDRAMREQTQGKEDE
jgi:hypothetical protein